MKTILDFLLFAGTIPCPVCKQPINMFARVLCRGDVGVPMVEQKRAGLCSAPGCGAGGKQYVEDKLEGAK